MKHITKLQTFLIIFVMKVSEELLSAAIATLDEAQKEMDEKQLISSIGCFGCGLGCTDTVGG